MKYSRNAKHINQTIDMLEKPISCTLPVMKKTQGDTMYVKFKSGDYMKVDCQDLSDWEEKKVHRHLPGIQYPKKIYELCLMAYKLRLITPADGWIDPIYYSFTNEMNKLRNEIGVEEILWDNDSRFEKYIHKPKINGDIKLYYDAVPSPKPRYLRFQGSKSHPITALAWYLPSEIKLQEKVQKIIAESKMRLS